MKQKIQRGEALYWPPAVLIYTDGASRGNPGPASAGWVAYQYKNPTKKREDQEITNDNRLFLYETAFLLGQRTNNFAEYSAVLNALKVSAENKVQNLLLKSDSELLVKQLSGLYKVKSLKIKKLYQECTKWVKAIPLVRFQHIPRHQNKRADALANMILDGHDLA